MRDYRLTVAWVVLGVVTAVSLWAHQVRAEERLDPAIGAPIPERYKSVRDAQGWLNPYLSVCPQGVIFSVRSVNRVRETVSLENLRTALLDLPVRAWPYGRIVALQDCSIGIPGDAEDRKKRMREVEAVMKALGLDMSMWPS